MYDWPGVSAFGGIASVSPLYSYVTPVVVISDHANTIWAAEAHLENSALPATRLDSAALTERAVLPTIFITGKGRDDRANLKVLISLVLDVKSCVCSVMMYSKFILSSFDAGTVTVAVAAVYKIFAKVSSLLQLQMYDKRVPKDKEPSNAKSSQTPSSVGTFPTAVGGLAFGSSFTPLAV
jgi:hypothetical protein